MLVKNDLDRLGRSGRAADVDDIVRNIGVVLSFSFLVASLVLFELDLPNSQLPTAWSPQFYVLLSVYTLCTIAVWFADRPVLFSIAVLMQVVVHGLVALGHGPNLDINLFFTLSFAVSSAVTVSGGLSYLAVITFCVIPIFPLSPYEFFDVIYAPAEANQIVMYCTVSIAFIIVIFGARKLYTHAADNIRISNQLNEAVLRLTSANVHFQEYAASAENRSIMEERNRLSSELHDAVGYTLTNIIMMVQATQDLIETDEQRSIQLLDTIRQQAQDGLAETRRALRALRASDSPRILTVQKIQRLVNAFTSSTNVMVKLEYGNVPLKLPQRVEAAVVRTVQESLTNAFRHGRASEVLIHCWRLEKRIQFSVEDNGQGIGSFHEGIGLQGMRERIEPLGGRVDLENTSKGARLFAWVPFDSTEDKDASDSRVVS